MSGTEDGAFLHRGAIDEQIEEAIEELREDDDEEGDEAGAQRGCPPKEKKFRSWCFRLCNYDEERWNLLPKMFEEKKHGIAYLIQGREICPSTGTPHIQGFIHFKTQRHLGGLKEICRRTTWLPKAKKSTFAQAANYCKKEGNFIEFGTLPRKGARTDILDLKAAAAAGDKKHVLFEKFGETYLKYSRAIDSVIFSYRTAQRIEKGYIHLNVIIHWGHTGTGKTKDANTDPANTYVAKHTQTGYWYDGYTDQKVLILDEFGCQMPLNDFKDRLDGHCNVLVPVKGGMTPQFWETVYITSQTDPRLWYSNCKVPDRQAMWNRVTKVVHYAEDGTKTVELEKAYRTDPDDWSMWLQTAPIIEPIFQNSQNNFR